MSPRAEQFWSDSQKYLEQAEIHLNPRLLQPAHVIGVHDEREWMRISYLFPTLPEKSKTDLLAVRRFYLFATEQQELERADPNASAEYAEAMAEQAASQLKEALPTFSDVQREILQKHYLLRMWVEDE
jgi:hypothetical protein